MTQTDPKGSNSKARKEQSNSWPTLDRNLKKFLIFTTTSKHADNFSAGPLILIVEITFRTGCKNSVSKLLFYN